MGTKPNILATRIVAQTRLFEIEEVDLHFSNGAKRCFERIRGRRSKGAVMIVPLLDHDTVLLVREYAVGLDRYEIGLPKGLIEGDEDLFAAAQREMMEETGYRANHFELLGKLAAAPGYMTSHMPVVIATDLSPAKKEGDEPEPIEVVPWKLNDLPTLLAREDISEARSIAALYLTLLHLQKNDD